MSRSLRRATTLATTPSAPARGASTNMKKRWPLCESSHARAAFAVASPVALDDGLGFREPAVEEREALRDAGLAAQQERGHRAAGREAAIAQQLRQRPHLGPEHEPAVVPDAVLEGQPARQQRGVAGKGLRRVRVGAREGDALGRQRVDRRHRAGGVAVDREVAVRQAVDRDQDDRALVRRRLARVPPASGGGAERQRADGDDDADGLPSARADRGAGGHPSCEPVPS